MLPGELLFCLKREGTSSQTDVEFVIEKFSGNCTIL